MLIIYQHGATHIITSLWTLHGVVNEIYNLEFDDSVVEIYCMIL